MPTLCHSTNVQLSASVADSVPRLCLLQGTNKNVKVILIFGELVHFDLRNNQTIFLISSCSTALTTFLLRRNDASSHDFSILSADNLNRVIEWKLLWRSLCKYCNFGSNFELVFDDFDPIQIMYYNFKTTYPMQKNYDKFNGTIIFKIRTSVPKRCLENNGDTLK